VKYLLRKAVLDNVPEIEITAEEYAEFEKARNILSSALAIEETYEILITNYLDFEKQILDITTGYMVRQHFDYSNSFETHLSLNIRLVNLLTAARLYEDQLRHNVPECVPNVPDAKEVVKKIFSKEYDANKEYRFMYALRNHVQHRGLAVHWIQPGGRWTSLEEDGLMEYSMELASLRSYLEENPHFNQRVLSELDEKIDLKVATRSYIESMSNVQESARSIIAESVKLSRELIEDAHRRYAAVHNESLVSLSACKWSNERQISAIPLLLEWDDIRVKLQKQNIKLINLRKRYVTSSTK
jgi:hypothetical protein